MVLAFFPQIHLCYSSEKKETTAVESSVFLAIAIISTIFNGGFLICMCYLRKKKEWPYREKQSENGNVIFYCFEFKQYKSFLLIH